MSMNKSKKLKQSGNPVKHVKNTISGLQERLEKLERSDTGQLEKRQKLAIQLLEVLNQPGEKMDLIRRILLAIKEFTGFECVAIRLKEEDDYPYYVTNGFPEDFVEAERFLCTRDSNGNPVRDSAGIPALECMCGNVIRGRTNPKYPFFTKSGSFWSNCTTKLLASTTEKERQARTRNRCNGQGYESVALIPLRVNGDTIGLLQLNDSRTDMFTPETIHFFERIGSSIGIAFKRTKIEEDRYRTTLDNMLEGVQIIGFDWRYLYINDTADKHNRRPKEELLGKKYMDMWPGIEATEVFAAIRRCLEGRIPHRMENEFVFPDGTKGWFELNIEPVAEGILILSQDITERRHNEAKISHLNNLLRAIRNVNQLITRERDRGRLLKEACDKLIETRGYLSVWIALFDRAGQFTGGAEAGLGDDFDRLTEILKAGKHPDCVRDTLKQPGVRVVADADAFCRRCPVHAKYPGKKIMLIRLEYNNVTYGMMVIAAPPEAALDAEEQVLFHEVAGDIAFALYNMETEHLQQQAEAEVLKLSNVVQQTADIVIITDKDGLIQYANPAFEKLTGHTKNGVIGQTPRILKSDKQDNTFYANLWKTIISGNTFRDELVNRKKDGELYYEEKTISPIKNQQGVITHFVSLGKDITERRRTDAALSASETRYRRLFEAARDGILILDAETGQVADVNKFLIDLLGFSHQQFMGKKIWDVGFFRDIIANKANFEELRRQKYIRYENMPLETADGRRIDVEFVSNVYIEDNLKVIQCNIRDITERKKLELQLAQTQKMEAIGQLVGGVAHDFNNALTVIDGYSSMMLDDLKPADPHHEGATAIKKAADHAAGLTRQLLAFSRKQVLQKKALNINTLTNNIQKMLTRVIGEHIRINLALSPELKNTNADPGQVEQVIMNLAVNARDAMPKGGTLTIKTENVAIDEEYCRINTDAKPGGFIRLSIQDTGIGMAEDVRKHLFEPFFTTKAFGKGTGLGLSVVYGIVKQHDGWINVYSEPDQGAIFTIYLPAIAVPTSVGATTAGLPDQTAPDALTGNGERILIVEDQAEILELLSAILRKNNYHVSIAATAKETAAIFDREKGRFHLILADVVLPDKTGVEVVAELTAINPALKVIFHSGYVDDQSHYSIIKEKGYCFLQKPYGAAELLGTIKQVLNAGKDVK